MSTDVFYDSDQAAKRVTLTGWVSRHGRFYGDDEHAARWDGCTHRQCDCGKAHERSRTMCDNCARKAREAKFEAMPFVEWDGVTPLSLFDDDRYFFSEDDLRDFCEAEEIAPDTLRLVVCEPQHARELDGNDYFCDLLPEDCTLDDMAPEIAEAFNKLNEVIKAYGKPLSWYPGKKRTRVELTSEAA
ncbi:MAG: hypothetical protein P4L85_14200 [Paludisphaera borealis]|uniref:hypothetical protein n=1 Tax=Paludisphaera borealis TaxID=1387353 RepID=UPI002845461C|nr:hypothetical protein [Paludisphaera borealis]MDR3620498.1 hypothetical protein [Paludisphaera borealis]